MPVSPSRDPLYRSYRFPAEIISHAVRLYYRFHLSHQDIEDLLAERGIAISYEAIRLGCRRLDRFDVGMAVVADHLGRVPAGVRRASRDSAYSRSERSRRVSSPPCPLTQRRSGPAVLS